MRTCALIGLIGAALAVSGLAAAQEPKEPTETVTVHGNRHVDAEKIRNAVEEFIGDHAAPSRRSGLMVRYAPPGICPATIGLPAAFNTFVTDRIKTVAEQIGAPVKRDCNRANLEVVFSPYPQKVIDILAKRTNWRILGFHYVHETDDMMQVTRPIQVWYATGTADNPSTAFNQIKDLSLSSSTAGVDSRLFGQKLTPGSVILDTDENAQPSPGTGSRIPPRNSGQFVNVLIVVNQTKLGGYEIGPVADYIAMLALSQTGSLDACSELPSVLDMFAKDCAGRRKPQGLTESDFAFLKALYAADITTSGAYGRATVRNKMTEEMTGGKE